MTTATLTPGLDGQLEKGVDIENNKILESTSPSSDSIQKEQYVSPAEPEPVAPRTVTGIRWFLICVAIFSANILYGLDTTIAADIQAAVSETFGDVALLGWLGVGFTLGSTVAILPLGKIFGNFDVKWVFLGCLTMFAAGSALCGGAPSMNAIIVGRVWAGVGGAGMYLGYGRPIHDLTISDTKYVLYRTLNLVTILTTPKEQPVYVGMIGFVYGGGCILGPIVGGSFADSSATWRWVCFRFPWSLVMH
jgi:MFS family permease